MVFTPIICVAAAAIAKIHDVLVPRHRTVSVMLPAPKIPSESTLERATLKINEALIKSEPTTKSNASSPTQHTARPADGQR